MSNHKYLVGNYNLYNIDLIPQRTNYAVYYKGGGGGGSSSSGSSSDITNKPMVFRTPIMRIPFGIENYMGKSVINAAFTNYRSNNRMHNFLTDITHIETFIENLSSDEDTVMNYLDTHKYTNQAIKDINNKQYVKSIKQRPKPYDPQLRIHIRNSSHPNIYTMNRSGEKGILSGDSIRGKAAIITLQLGSIWIKDNSYGPIWYANSIQILD